jgi:hypothetical protein
MPPDMAAQLIRDTTERIAAQKSSRQEGEHGRALRWRVTWSIC